MKYLKNKKGSALVLVLSCILILTALGSVVLFACVANIQMGTKYTGWSKEYYELDSIAEQRLMVLDKKYMAEAEEFARFYMQNELYSLNSLDGWDYEDTNGNSHSLDSLMGSRLQASIYQGWTDDVAPAVVGEEIDKDDLKAYLPKVFKLLYSRYVTEQLIADTAADAEGKIDQGTQNAISFEAVVTNAGHLSPDTWGDAQDFIDDISADAPIAALNLTVMDATAEAVTNKMVSVHAAVVIPQYDTLDQVRYTPVKANPLWTNALSVKGNIVLSGNCSVYGDVVSCNQQETGLNSYSVDEGNAYGIRTGADTSTVHIYGNVYSAGDLHVSNSYSAISVHPYDASHHDSVYKNKLYSDAEEPFLFSFANYKFTSGDTPGNPITQYAEDTASGCIPFFYKDASGGNVYCNSLSVEKNEAGTASILINGRISVSGNVWTNDDIQLDGESSGGGVSSITVSQNYIGINSAPNNSKDPNSSSSVINNTADTGSQVRLLGDFVIPGTAFYRFGTAASPDYYQSGESATAKLSEMLEAYIRPDGSAGSEVHFDEEGTSYTVVEQESPELKADLVKAALGVNVPETNVQVSADPAGYSLGVVAANNGSGYSVITTSGDSQSENNNAYSYLTGGQIQNIFRSKTRYFGTDTSLDRNFDRLTNGAPPSGAETVNMYYYSGNTSVDLSVISQGIIYAAGDLTLYGGTFRGSVICRGTLTLSNATVYYDEDVISGVLDLDPVNYTDSSMSRGVRRFFSPPGMSIGEQIRTEEYTTTAADAGTRDIVKRYQIRSWKEKAIS